MSRAVGFKRRHHVFLFEAALPAVVSVGNLTARLIAYLRRDRVVEERAVLHDLRNVHGIFEAARIALDGEAHAPLLARRKRRRKPVDAVTEPLVIGSDGCAGDVYFRLKIRVEIEVNLVDGRTRFVLKNLISAHGHVARLGKQIDLVTDARDPRLRQILVFLVSLLVIGGLDLAVVRRCELV